MKGIKLEFGKHKGYVFEVELIVTDKKEDFSFLGNNNIQKKLSNIKSGEKIGNLKMIINHGSTTAEWTTYYPYGNPYRKNYSQELERTGIATITEYLFLKELKKRYPEVKRIKHSFNTKKPRERQLNARRISINENNLIVSIDSEIKAIRKKIAEHKVKDATIKQKLKWRLAKTKRAIKTKMLRK